MRSGVRGPGPYRSTRWRVVLDAGVSVSIDRHLGATTNVEQAGVLVGTHDEDAVYIHAAIPARHGRAERTAFTFTQETWADVNETLERDHAGGMIVGWYHSHPGFSVFLSDYDTFVHRSFFRDPWQVAYVVDPLSTESGFFGWEDGELVRCDTWDLRRRIEPDSLRPVQEPLRSAPPQTAAARPLRWPLAAALLALIATGAGAFWALRDQPSATADPISLPPVLRHDGVVVDRTMRLTPKNVVVEVTVTTVDGCGDVCIVTIPVPVALKPQTPGNSQCGAPVGDDVARVRVSRPSNGRSWKGRVEWCLRSPPTDDMIERVLAADRTRVLGWMVDPGRVSERQLSVKVGEEARVPLGDLEFEDGSVAPIRWDDPQDSHVEVVHASGRSLVRGMRQTRTPVRITGRREGFERSPEFNVEVTVAG